MPTLAEAVSAYGASLKAKLSSAAIAGAPEDQLRAPLETLIGHLAELCGFAGAVHLVGETTLNELPSRPYYAVTVYGALVGFVEIQAPARGGGPRRFSDPRESDGSGREEL